MQRLSDWASKHPWSYLLLWPIFLLYIIWKSPKALAEWGKS